MYNYLLNVTFFAGSNDKDDTDRGMYLIKSEKELSEEEMKEAFDATNQKLKLDEEEIIEENFPNYEDGINIHTLMLGLGMYLGVEVIELHSNHGPIADVSNYYVIEQWQ